MGRTIRYANNFASELAEKGTCSITFSQAKKGIKEAYSIASPWNDHIRQGFERAGWEKSGELFYLLPEFSQKVEDISRELKADGDPVVAKGKVSQKVAGIDWPSGEWGEVVDDTMQDEGWKTDESNGLYFLPVSELVTESSLSYHLFNSFAIPDAN